MSDTASQITLQVHDQDNNAYDVHLAIAPAGTGTLAIQDTHGQVIQQHDLARIRKSPDATTLSCRVGFTTATVRLDPATNPPSLHIAARAFLPLFSATYTLSSEEQQRLQAWLGHLPVAILV